jgi:hypothetical protein
VLAITCAAERAETARDRLSNAGRTTISFEQLAYRIASRLNAIPRLYKDFTKSDFNIYNALPDVILDEFVSEFTNYSQQEFLLMH